LQKPFLSKDFSSGVCWWRWEQWRNRSWKSPLSSSFCQGVFLQKNSGLWQQLSFQQISAR